jgi:hypothetical protein
MHHVPFQASLGLFPADPRGIAFSSPGSLGIMASSLSLLVSSFFSSPFLSSFNNKRFLTNNRTRVFTGVTLVNQIVVSYLSDLDT